MENARRRFRGNYWISIDRISKKAYYVPINQNEGENERMNKNATTSKRYDEEDEEREIVTLSFKQERTRDFEHRSRGERRESERRERMWA